MTLPPPGDESPSQSLRYHVEDGVAQITLTRGAEYNTITPQMRSDLEASLRAADDDPDARVVLLNAEGPAFCAGYGLDWATPAQSSEQRDGEPVWDSVRDQRMISRFTTTWALLHELPIPTVAAVQGWCIAGGTNIVFNADLIVAADDARFGYPPSRVWGVPEAPWTWVARMGLERAKRYMLTGDEFTGAEAARMGVILESVPAADLEQHALDLAKRIAQVPANQLVMIKTALNEVARHAYDPPGSRLVGTLFDGIARHTQEGLDFVTRSAAVGFREAVRERDRPFGDYGERGSAPATDPPS